MKTSRFSNLLLAGLLMLGTGSALAAADSGPRKHAEGQYDASTNTYTVVAGDDLSEIGERFGTTVGALERLNKLASDKITVGQTLVVAAAGTAGAADGDKPKMATEMPAGITAPAEVKTRLGTLRTKDGFPDKATIEKVYDNLDFQRGVQSILTAMPAASLSAMRKGLRTQGPDNQTAVIFEDFMDSRTLFLTANATTIYSIVWLNTKETGPLVIEVPPDVLGTIDDFWFHWVSDAGITGPDKGKGGKYLMLPPGYKDVVPKGYFVLRSPTYNNWFFFRGFVVDGSTAPAV